jgi:hypothetical protein
LEYEINEERKEDSCTISYKPISLLARELRDLFGVGRG